jgi:predicted ATP-grasp superfamily ATP-dependent carboligase
MPNQTINTRQGTLAADGAPAAIVLGGGINGLSVVRSLAQAGLRPVVVVNSKYDIAMASRYARRFVVSTFHGEDFVEELLRLRSALPQGGVIIFADDRPLLTVSQYRNHVAPLFGFQLPPHELLVDLTLKERFFRLAQQGGFPAPKTLLLRKHSDLNGLGDLQPPLCVKANSRSQAYDGAFRKAYRVETRADARLLCEQVLDRVGEVIVQEWIEGSNDSIYFCLCYLGPAASVAFTGRKARSWPPQIGLTASCWAAPEAAEQLENLTIRFFQSIGLTSGFASMEYKRDQRDGVFRFVEPTVGRIDGQIEISALCGINLCHVAYCDSAGQPCPPLKLDPTHVWRDEFKDFISARLLGTSCFYPPRHRIHNAYWRWDDPGPALLVAANSVKQILRRVIGHLPKTKAISARQEMLHRG